MGLRGGANRKEQRRPRRVLTFRGRAGLAALERVGRQPQDRRLQVRLAGEAPQVVLVVPANLDLHRHRAVAREVLLGAHALHLRVRAAEVREGALAGRAVAALLVLPRRPRAVRLAVVDGARDAAGVGVLRALRARLGEPLAARPADERERLERDLDLQALPVGRVGRRDLRDRRARLAEDDGAVDDAKVARLVARRLEALVPEQGDGLAARLEVPAPGLEHDARRGGLLEDGGLDLRRRALGGGRRVLGSGRRGRVHVEGRSRRRGRGRGGVAQRLDLDRLLLDDVVERRQPDVVAAVRAALSTLGRERPKRALGALPCHRQAALLIFVRSRREDALQHPAHLGDASAQQRLDLSGNRRR